MPVSLRGSVYGRLLALPDQVSRSRGYWPPLVARGREIHRALAASAKYSQPSGFPSLWRCVGQEEALSAVRTAREYPDAVTKKRRTRGPTRDDAEPRGLVAHLAAAQARGEHPTPIFVRLGRKARRQAEGVQEDIDAFIDSVIAAQEAYDDEHGIIGRDADGTPIFAKKRKQRARPSGAGETPSEE